MSQTEVFSTLNHFPIITILPTYIKNFITVWQHIYTDFSQSRKKFYILKVSE